MKIGYAGLELPEGKVKFEDPLVDLLVEKEKPKKVEPYYAEMIPNEFEHVHVIAVATENMLDVLIIDMEKCESQIAQAEDETKKALVQRCLDHLENEKPICDLDLSEEVS